MFRVLVSCLVLLGAASAALAQPIAGAEMQLTLQPAKEPVPALKYQLAFELRDQNPGNAAVHYFRAMLVHEEKHASLGREKQREQNNKLEQWMNMPLKDLPRAEVRAYLDHYKEVFALLEQAARCERCDWKLEESLRKEGIGVLTPEIQKMRLFTYLLQFKLPLELAEGNLDQAAHSLRIGFSMARHTSESPTLISALVGIALTGIMCGELDRFVQQPGAPNLYWALADLPRPFIDLRKAFQGERLVTISLFPGFREMASDLRAGPMTPQQAADLIGKLAKLADPKKREDEDAQRLAILNMAGRMHGDAKKFLLEQGRNEQDVEKMPLIQAALLYQLNQYDRALDDIIKLQSLPYYEAQPRRVELDAKFKAQVAKEGGATIVGMLVPAVAKVHAAQIRIERKLAALRCVEAVRLYAAGHDGKPPAKLEDIKEVPVPLDPFTGKAFAYKTEGDKATIEGPAPDGEKPFVNNYIRYEVTIKR